ncbi:hypothetical protein [Streptomyces sp. NPDC091209]
MGEVPEVLPFDCVTLIWVAVALALSVLPDAPPEGVEEGGLLS